MNKQEVIDYVMNTPHNVNRTILSQSLDEIGAQADWNQNDPTKPDYVKNRTHYTETVNAIYEVDLAKDGIDGSNFEWGKPGFLYIETTEEIVQLFKDNWDKVVFTRNDGTIYKTVDMEKKSNIYSMTSISGDVTIGVNHTPNYTSNIGASVPGVISVEYPKEVVHKIPEKYLPDGIGGGSGGGSNVMIIHLNEADAENQVYPEGLYDAIDRMVKNSFFDTFIMVGDANAEYNTIVFRPIQRINKDDSGYVIKLASPSSNRILHVRPDNSGWLEWEE